jgi:ribosome biogenesis GTPase
VLPRRTAFVRKAAFTTADQQVVAANVDVALLVASMNGDLNARRLERYLATAWQSGAAPVVVLTKADLARDPEAAIAEAESVAFGAPVLVVSAVTGEGLDDLAAQLKPAQTAVLVGSSGVGKSSLVNALAGEALMTVAAIREDDAKGRHTTTHRELIRLPSGALILDTPGMRELGLIDADEGLSTTFEDVEALAGQCRFSDCGHTNEPGCAIQSALETGVLDPGRWTSFQKLQRELAHQQRKEDHLAREAHRRKWIGVHKAARAHMKAKREW